MLWVPVPMQQERMKEVRVQNPITESGQAIQ